MNIAVTITTKQKPYQISILPYQPINYKPKHINLKFAQKSFTY